MCQTFLSVLKIHMHPVQTIVILQSPPASVRPGGIQNRRPCHSHADLCLFYRLIHLEIAVSGHIPIIFFSVITIPVYIFLLPVFVYPDFLSIIRKDKIISFRSRQTAIFREQIRIAVQYLAIIRYSVDQVFVPLHVFMVFPGNFRKLLLRQLPGAVYIETILVIFQLLQII